MGPVKISRGHPVPEESSGKNPGDNPGESSGENPGESSGENLGESSGENPGGMRLEVGPDEYCSNVILMVCGLLGGDIEV